MKIREEHISKPSPKQFEVASANNEQVNETMPSASCCRPTATLPPRPRKVDVQPPSLGWFSPPSSDFFREKSKAGILDFFGRFRYRNRDSGVLLQMGQAVFLAGLVQILANSATTDFASAFESREVQ